MTGPYYLGTYIGPLKHLKGKTALVRRLHEGVIVVQFDDKSLRRVSPTEGDHLAWGWHGFPVNEFQIDPRPLNNPKPRHSTP
jgi:hypothetical protein